MGDQGNGGLQRKYTRGDGGKQSGRRCHVVRLDLVRTFAFCSKDDIRGTQDLQKGDLEKSQSKVEVENQIGVMISFNTSPLS